MWEGSFFLTVKNFSIPLSNIRVNANDVMKKISLKLAAEKAGIDKSRAVQKLDLLLKNYPVLNNLLKKKDNHYKLHYGIIDLLKLDLRKTKDKIELAKMISKYELSGSRKVDLETENGKAKKNDSDINIEKEKNTKREKTGGRQKGTPNRITKNIRSMLNDFMLRKFENIDQYFNPLTDKDKIYFIVNMTPYVLSKNPVENDSDQVPEWQKKFKNMTPAQKYEALKKLITEKKNEKKRKK